MSIKEVKENYQYKYSFILVTDKKEVEGYIYNVDNIQYFINNNNNYITIINE